MFPIFCFSLRYWKRLSQLETHLSRNNLREVCQSAYRQNHSTETLFLSVTYSLLCKADNRFVLLLTSLDQSAAFDTVDHNSLLNRLSYSFGISRTVFKWFISYQQTTVCFCGRHKLFVFAIEIGCTPGFCPWTHSFTPYTLNLFLTKLAQYQLPEICI